MECKVLASGTTALRPARELPEGSRLQLITGLRGSVSHVELMRGLMVAEKGSSCSHSGVRMDEE